MPLTKVDDRLGETTHRWAMFLPDGKHFLYLAGMHEEAIGRGRDAIYLTSLDAPRSRTLLLRARSNVAYAAGHLLFMRDGELVAQRFDANRRALSGDAFRVGARPSPNSSPARSPSRTTARSSTRRRRQRRISI